MRNFIIVLLIFAQGCTSSSSSKSSPDTYVNTYNSDDNLATENVNSKPSKSDLIENLNSNVTQLYLNNPIVEEFNWEGKFFTTEYSRDLGLRKMVCCYKLNENEFEQIELFIENKEVAYYRWDLFEGSSCSDMQELKNVEKGYIWNKELLYTSRLNNDVSFSLQSSEEKLDFILKIESELLQGL